MQRLKNKLESITVPPENPFANDALNRKPLVDLLTSRIAKSETPYVLAINGAWGSGKTKLVEMLIAELRSQHFFCAYFNAWRHDHGENALAAMICSLSDLAGEKEENEKAVSLREAADTLALGTLKQTASWMGITPLLEAVLKQSPSKEWSPLKNHADYLAKINDFKMALGKFGVAGKPLVFFVDELDRCRPDFAVAVLEKIKHVFDVPNVFFVVSLNKDALAMTICNVYGYDERESNKYLRRFFDDEITVPQGDMTGRLVERIGIPGYFQTRSDYHKGQLSEAAKGEPKCIPQILSLLLRAWAAFISLRDQEQIVTLFTMAMRRVPFKSCVSPYLMIYFVALKFRGKELYNETRSSLNKVNKHGHTSNAAFPFKKHFTLLDEIKSSATADLRIRESDYAASHYRLCVHLAVLACKNCPEEHESIQEWWQDQSRHISSISELVSNFESDIGRQWDLIPNLSFYFDKIEGVDPDIYDDTPKKNP